MPDTQGLNIIVTARIDNESIFKLLVMFLALIVIFFIAKRLIGG
jgi:hypothetical protein